MKLMRRFAAILILLAWPMVVYAADPSPEFRARAAEIVALFNGSAEPDQMFAPAFLAQVPAAQVKTISTQMKDNYGRAVAVQRIEATTPNSGTVFVDFEKAVVRAQMAIGAAAPHRIEQLLIAGVDVKGDSVRAVFGELTALPGEVTIAAATLGDGAPANFLTQKAEQPGAVGSSFKLFILAELARAVKADERKYSDVVPLDYRSLPSGLLQDWPKGSPITLHSLAALMISRSDNSATDTLLHALGREKVEAILPVVGVAAPARLRPFLSTREAFAVKLSDPAALAAWRAADEAGRRARLASMASARDASGLDASRLAAAPNALDVEWYASPADLVRTLDWLRRTGDQTILDLLAINPGLGRAMAQDFAYMGFKGGSEPGVLNTSFLLRNREGRWIATSVTWNNPAAPLDEAKFIALIGRLIATMK